MSDASQLGLSQNQLQNALGIIEAVKKRKWPARAAVIAVETALAESGMRILASANVPASLQYPHDLLSWTSDGLGHDHASCGMFQQQTGWAWCLPGTTTMGSADGWGTPAELMNPELSTEKFLHALGNVGWAHLTRWAAAQAVQRSAFPDGRNYRQQDARALQIVRALWGGLVVEVPAKPTAPKPTSTLIYVVVRGDSMSKIAKRFRTTVPTLAALNHVANPDKLRVGQRLSVPARRPPIPTKSTVRLVGHYRVRRGDTLVTICRQYPQAWVTPQSVARLNALSNPNHIVIGQDLRIGG